MYNKGWRSATSNLEMDVLNYFCFHSQFHNCYCCSLKHNDTKILDHVLPFYFLFYFPFSSKKPFPAKKYLANSLEIKTKWPFTLSPHNKHVCFHRKSIFFGIYEHVPDFCFTAEEDIEGWRSHCCVGSIWTNWQSNINISETQWWGRKGIYVT